MNYYYSGSSFIGYAHSQADVNGGFSKKRGQARIKSPAGRRAAPANPVDVAQRRRGRTLQHRV
jgi:hypothetical protein